APNLYPLSNFTLSTKEAQPEEDPSVSARLQRLQNNYEDFGMRRTVEGILADSPGDYLKPGEDEINGPKRLLDDRLAPPTGSEQFNASHGVDNDWEIGDCLAQWWRPNFETFMPKECKKLFLVQTPERKVLTVPKNMKLLGSYGPQLSAIPHLLSRYNFISMTPRLLSCLLSFSLLYRLSKGCTLIYLVFVLTCRFVRFLLPVL
ncbi:hypothetical protein BDZ89DRAFT_1066602, partial [Hymenopellis radicata]